MLSLFLAATLFATPAPPAPQERAPSLSIDNTPINPTCEEVAEAKEYFQQLIRLVNRKANPATCAQRLEACIAPFSTWLFANNSLATLVEYEKRVCLSS